MKFVIVLAAALCVVSADFSLDRSYDTLYDLARLYRMQNLNNFDDYNGDDINSRSGDDWVAPYGDDMYKDAQFGGTHLRDQEHIEQSSLYGAQAIAGGTAEGKPNQKQVKTDKPLPAYCNPPNPCPVGYNAKKNNCVENFNNSADYNRELMAKQDCPCDTEHMFACPEGRGTVSSKSQGDSAAIKQVMEELNTLGASDINDIMSNADGPHTLVAKKSPELSRLRRSTGENLPNPYFEGEIKRIVAKKGMEYKQPQ